METHNVKHVNKSLANSMVVRINNGSNPGDHSTLTYHSESTFVNQYLLASGTIKIY